MGKPSKGFYVSLEDIVDIELVCGSITVTVFFVSEEGAINVTSAVEDQQLVVRVGEASIVALPVPPRTENGVKADTGSAGAGGEANIDGDVDGGNGRSDGDSFAKASVDNSGDDDDDDDNEIDSAGGAGAAVQWGDSELILPVVGGGMALILLAFTLWVIYRHRKFAQKNKVAAARATANSEQQVQRHNVITPSSRQNGYVAGQWQGQQQQQQQQHPNLFSSPNGTAPRWMAGKNKGKRAMMFQPAGIQSQSAEELDQIIIRENMRILALQHGQMHTPYMDHMHTRQASGMPAGPWNVAPRPPLQAVPSSSSSPMSRANMSPYPPAQWYTPRQRGNGLGPLRSGGAGVRMPPPPAALAGSPMMQAAARTPGGRGEVQGVMLPTSSMPRVRQPHYALVGTRPQGQGQQQQQQQRGARAAASFVNQPSQAPWFNNGSSNV